MSRQPVWSGVERAGLQRRGLVGLLARQIAREHVMADAENSAVAIGAEAKALDGVGAVGGHVKDLLPGQADFHRALEPARQDCSPYRSATASELPDQAAAQ